MWLTWSSSRPHLLRRVDVAEVHDDGLTQGVLHAVEVKRAELVPLGDQHDGVGRRVADGEPCTVGLNPLRGPRWRPAQHGERQVDGHNPREALREQTRVGADAAADFEGEASGCADWV